MRPNHPSRVGSTVIELLVHVGLIAIVIALLIPVVLTHDDFSATEKLAQKVTRKPPASHRGLVSTRTMKL